jgi:hypothetical protein
MLAIILALEEWHAKLEGLLTAFFVYLNYKALKYFITIKKLSAQQAQ